MQNEFEFVDKVWGILCESNKMDVVEIENGLERLTSHIRASEKLWQMHWFIMQIASETDLHTVSQLTLNTFHSLVNPAACAIFIYNEEDEELKEYSTFGKLSCKTDCDPNKPSLLSKYLNGSMKVQHTCDCNYDYVRVFPFNKRDGSLLGYLVGYCHGKEYEINDEIRMFVDIFSVQIGLSIEGVLIRDKMERLAYIDELTNLSNKRVLISRLEESMLRCVQAKVQKKDHKGVGVILYDVDSFKHYNDTFGHIAGDDVLRKLGSIINGITTEGQLGARYGGEELCVILDNATIDETYALAEKIRKAIEDTEFEFRVVTVSGGVAHYPTVKCNTNTEFLNAADKALYKSKTTGKNKITINKG